MSLLATLGVGRGPDVSAPLNLAATAGDQQVDLTWDKVTWQGADVTGYRVYWDTDSGAPYANVETVTLAQLADSENPSWTVDMLTNDVLYYFAVTAIVET